MRLKQSLRLLFLLAVLFLLGLEVHSLSGVLLVYSFALLLFLFALVQAERSIILFGIVFCLCPAFGSGVLSFLFCAWIVGMEATRANNLGPGIRSTALGYGASLLVFMNILGALRTIGKGFEWDVLRNIERVNGTRESLLYVLEQLSHQNHLLQTILGSIVFVLLVNQSVRLRWDSVSIGHLGLGLLYGMSLSVMLFFLQAAGVTFDGFLERDQVWISMSRFSAGFRDPNAFGVMAVLLIPLCFAIHRTNRNGIAVGVSILFFVTSLYSGSRTELLGLIIYLGLSAKALWRGGYIKSLLGGLILLVTTALFAQQISMPSVARLAQTVNVKTAGSMLESRILYNKIAWEVFQVDPIVGVGLNRFFQLQDRAAARLDIPLRGWRDNANNYYLQVLAEEGVVGFLLLVGAFYFLYRHLRRESGNSEIVSGTVVRLLQVFMVLLLFGPHVNFEEVRYLLALLLALGNYQGEKPVHVSPRTSWFIAAGMAFFSGLYLLLPNSNSGISGFYPRESGEEGSYAWMSGRESSMHLCRESKKPFDLQFQALQPDIAQHPVRLRVLSGEGRVLVSKTFRGSGWQRVRIKPKVTDYQGAELLLKFWVSRTWSPQQFAPQGDRRVFGLMLRWPKHSCW